MTKKQKVTFEMYVHIYTFEARLHSWKKLVRYSSSSHNDKNIINYKIKRIYIKVIPTLEEYYFLIYFSISILYVHDTIFVFLLTKPIKVHVGSGTLTAFSMTFIKFLHTLSSHWLIFSISISFQDKKVFHKILKWQPPIGCR